MSIIETIIDIPVEHERNVCGQFDSSLKKIERTLHVTMITRDGALKIIGPEQAIRQAKIVFNNLIELSKRGNHITEQNVDYALSLSFTEQSDQILEIDKDIICRTITGKPIKPKTMGMKDETMYVYCGDDGNTDGILDMGYICFNATTGASIRVVQEFERPKPGSIELANFKSEAHGVRPAMWISLK